MHRWVRRYFLRGREEEGTAERRTKNQEKTRDENAKYFRGGKAF